VCFFWGTTYLGIRVAVETVSPIRLMALRYLFSGGVLLLGARAAGARFPTLREAWKTALYGLMTIGISTGALSFGELWIPSGLASLFASLQPFWLVSVEALTPGGERLHWPSIGGMCVGLAGVVLLLLPGGSAAVVNQGMVTHGSASQGPGAHTLLGGFLLLQFGALCWAMGSVWQRRLGGRAHPFVSGGVQQLATGIVYAIPALLEPTHTDWTTRGSLAVLYLAVFGGLIGYSAFIYSMHHLPVALMSIYTYINPLVAMALGWWFYREPFGWRETAAMLVIFAGVTIVKWTIARGLHTAETSVAVE
jgi:drug/metabolite transporter (DMT)-like permease